MLPNSLYGKFAVVMAAAGLVMALAAASATACGEVKYKSAHRTPTSAGKAPLLIGDSTSILAVPKLARLGIEADAHGCRQFSQGLQILARRKRASRLPHVVILALGANGPIQGSQISRALRIIGRSRVLVLVTPRKSGVSAGAMRRAARRKPNQVALVEWAGISSRHGGWFAGDGLHPGYGGAAAFAKIIKRAVVPFGFPPVKKLSIPKSKKHQEYCGVVHRGGYRLRVFLLRSDKRSTCDGAIKVAKRPPLKKRSGWGVYDLRAVKRAKWLWIYKSTKRRVMIATKM